MRLVDLISLIVDNLKRRKGRVVLTAIGVIIGTAAVVTLISLGAGLKESATSQLWGINDLSNVEVYPGYPEMMAGGMVTTITEDDIKKITPDVVAQFEAMPGVQRVIIKQSVNAGVEIKLDKMMAWGNITGVNLDDLSDMGVAARQGITDVTGKGTIVVGSWIENNFYDPNQRPGDEPFEPPDLMGQTLRIDFIKWNNDGTETRKSMPMQVVGVLEETRGEADYSIYMNWDDVIQLNDWVAGRRVDYSKQGYNNVTVKATSPEVVIDLAQQITDMGYQAYTPQSQVQSINSFFTIMQVVFGGVGAIALLVAAIGIANTMAMAILERTREIGIMKAIGATNNNILSIFLGEAAGIGFLGGVGGFLLGWAICGVINLLAGSYLASQSGGGTTLATSIPVWLPLFSIVFATIVGLISGLYPALSAATLVPVNALKYE
ncbi:MAG: ABC transporter permease [Anaerolineaceae bacterium]|nr:ABC transporter permease [Anaerolineaceae bacterium]